MIAFDPRPKRVTEWIRQHALGSRPSYEQALTSAAEKLDPPGWTAERDAPAEWREKCRARLILGTLRYEVCGRMPYDAIGSAIKRLAAYQQDGNLEHLVDVANLCRVEWLRPNRATESVGVLEVLDLLDALAALVCYHLFGHRSELPAVADWCLGEFVSPTHPKAHWRAQGEHGLHAEEVGS